MKKACVGFVFAAVALLASGCAHMAKDSASFYAHLGVPASDSTDDAPIERKMIWSAFLSLEVWNVSNAVAEVASRVERQGGYIESRSGYGESSAELALRVPAAAFQTALSGLEELGTVTYRSVTGKDVTEEYVDVEARLKNKIALRDRLKQLLDKATDVKDILAIEAELNRVQSDIDSMTGRLQALKGKVDYATISLALRRKPILGPLGYVVKGVFWGIGKLFVLRE